MDVQNNRPQVYASLLSVIKPVPPPPPPCISCTLASQLLSELVLYFVHKYLILSSCHFDKNCDRIGRVEKKYHTGSDFMNTEVIYVSGTDRRCGKRNFSGPFLLHRKIFRNWTGPETPSPPTVFHRLLGQSWLLPASRSWIFLSNSTEKGAFFRHLRHGNSRNTTRSWKTRSAPFSRTTTNTSAAFFCQGKMPIRVRENEAMLGTEHDQLASRLIKNFDEALFSSLC